MDSARTLSGAAALEMLDQVFSRLLLDYNDGLPLMVAIDIESSKTHLSEIGISAFDPYCLLHGSDDPNVLNEQIRTYCYSKGGSNSRRQFKPYRLGTPQRFQNSDVRQLFDTHLKPKDDDGSIRKIILIGHSVGCDLRLLKECWDVDLSRLSNIQAILDTQKIAQPILQATRRLSLKHILGYFQLSYVGLHNAAHDSRYTLRVLLMLFTAFKRLSKVDQNEMTKAGRFHSEQSDNTQMKNDQAKSDRMESEQVKTKPMETERLESMLLLMERIAQCHKIRPGRTWTISTKTKPSPISDPDLFDRGDLDEDYGLLALLA